MQIEEPIQQPMSDGPDELDSADQDTHNESSENDHSATATKSRLCQVSQQTVSALSDRSFQISFPNSARNYLKFAPSGIFTLILIIFLTLYGPILLENPGTITPDEETYSIKESVGIGEHENKGYRSASAESSSHRDFFVSTCTPKGNYLSTGTRFNCRYNISSTKIGGPSMPVEFEREFLDRIANKPLLVAEWKRLSPEEESVYVTHRYGYSSNPTLEGTFSVYTPTEPGEYRFRLLISTYLNPAGKKHPNASVILTSFSTVYVYSQEQAASFRISAATYRLEQVAIIGITIAILQLIFSTYPSQKG